MHDTVIVRKVFEHWKIYVIHKLRTRRATYKAHYFYCKKQQKKVFKVLSNNVLLKWKLIVSPTENNTNKFTISVNGIKAEVQYIKILLKRYFTYWYKYIMIKHEKSIMLKRAITYYNLNCLKKCITNWKIHIVQKKKKKIIQDKVDKVISFVS